MSADELASMSDLELKQTIKSIQTELRRRFAIRQGTDPELARRMSYIRARKQ